MTKRDRNEPLSIQIGGNGIRRRLLAATVLCTALFAGVGGWAAQAKLAGAVISHGEVVISGEVKHIQHVEGGTVVEIPVKAGDLVRKGDVVLRLDDTQARVELDIIKNQMQQLQAMRSRLVAEREGESELTFTGLDLAADVQREELKLFAGNRAFRENQKQQLRLQRLQLENQIQGLREQQKASEAEEELLVVEIQSRNDLMEKKLTRASELRDMQRQIARVRGSIGDSTAKIAEAEGQISELEIKLASIDQTLRSEVQKEIVTLDGRMAELQQRAIAVSHRLDRTTVRAPDSGYIYDLQAHTIGGVIAPGQAIMSLVPQEGDLKVDVKVAPSDIDRISPHQHARLRFVSFNQRTTPEVAGNVSVVAAATSVDPASNMSYYKASVAFEPESLGAMAAKLQPGMPVEVYIETEERTVVSFLMKPMQDQIMRAFREE